MTTERSEAYTRHGGRARRVNPLAEQVCPERPVLRRTAALPCETCECLPCECRRLATAEPTCSCGQVADLDGEVCRACTLKAWDRQCALLRAEGRRLILRGTRLYPNAPKGQPQNGAGTAAEETP